MDIDPLPPEESRAPTELRRVASCAGAGDRAQTEQPASEILVSTSSVLPWTPFFLGYRMEISDTAQEAGYRYPRPIIHVME